MTNAPALASSATVAQAVSYEIGNAGTCHIDQLTGPLPNTRYYYRLKSNGVVVQDVLTFKPPSDTSDTFFTVIGDWGQQSTGESQAPTTRTRPTPTFS